MPKNKNRSLFNKYLKKMRILKKEQGFSDISSALKKGKNSYMRLDRFESSGFDMVWIKRIEDCIYDLGEIIANPREVTKVVTSIVPVELAKKTGSESVMHLASHTQYIKDITPEGDVVPNKILNIGAEEDIHTYENRFIATLVRRLVLFIEKRYEFVKNFAHLHDEEVLYFKNKSIVDGAEVEIETKIKVRSESSNKMADSNNKYIERILKIREYVLYFYGSRFMKDFKTERDVRNPIVMTNILRKNPKYHKCYELYRFIEKYDRLGVSYKVNEDVSTFSDEEMNEMNMVMMSNYLALKSKNVKKPIKSLNKEYKPKILTSLDDEEFVYGDLLKGPIEFMRIDQGYLDYLDSQVKKDLPIHPTKLEKEYYEDEYKEKKDIKVQKEAIDKLTKRKKKEQVEFDKKAQAMVAQREKEEQERIEAEKEAARLAEEQRLDVIRQQLIEQAKAEHPVEEQRPVVEEQPVVEEAPAEAPVEETPVEQVQEEAPVAEEAPIEQQSEEQPAPVEESAPEVVEEQTEPEQQPVQEEQAPVEERVVVVEQPQAEEPVAVVSEEAPVEEAPIEEEVQPEPEVVEVVPAAEEEPQPAEESEPVVEEVKEEPQQVVEEPVEEKPVEQPQHKKKRKIIWITFTDKDGKTKKVPQFIVDGEEEPVVKAKPQPAPVVKQEEKPVEPVKPVEEKPVEPAPQPKKKRKIIWITFVDKNGHKKKVPQFIVDGEEPVEQPASEPVKEEPKVEEPVPAPVEEPTPVEEAPVIEEPVQEEQPVEESPVEEIAPVQEEEVAEEAPVEQQSEEQPIEEESQPEVVEEPVQEEAPVEETPEVEKKEEKAEISEEKPTSAEILDENKEEKHSRRERKPKKEKPQKEERLGPKLEPIPGRFVVKTSQGYFVNKNKYTVYKNEAWVFGDFNDANRIKNIYGGKVVKL